jgi:hypothetical protein
VVFAAVGHPGQTTTAPAAAGLSRTASATTTPLERSSTSAGASSTVPTARRQVSGGSDGGTMLAVLVALAVAAVAMWPLLRRGLEPLWSRREPLTLGRPTHPRAKLAPGAEPDRHDGRAVQKADSASPPATGLAPAAGDRPAAPADPSHRWFAEVRWDETASTPRFRVAARAPGATAEHFIAESQPVEWPPPNPEAFRRLTQAAQALSDALVQAGWTPVERGDAWYAARFVWEPADDSAPTDAPSRPRRATASPSAAAAPPARSSRPPSDTWPPETEALWRCEICWHRGWITSHFEAMAHDPAAASRPVARSDSFMWTMRADPDPADVRTRAAVRAVRNTLLADGWSRVEPGALWYAERFVWRHVGTPPDHTRQARPTSAAPA